LYLRNHNNSKFALHPLGNSHFFRKMEKKILDITQTSIHVDTMEKIYKETVNGNQLNVEHTMMSIKILEAIKSEIHCT